MANVHHYYFDKFVISTLSTSEREKEWKACLIPYAMILVSGKRICVCKLLYIWHDIFCGSFVSFYLGITIHLNGFDIFHNHYAYHMFYMKVYALNCNCSIQQLWTNQENENSKKIIYISMNTRVIVNNRSKIISFHLWKENKWKILK